MKENTLKNSKVGANLQKSLILCLNFNSYIFGEHAVLKLLNQILDIVLQLRAKQHAWPYQILRLIDLQVLELRRCHLLHILRARPDHLSLLFYKLYHLGRLKTNSPYYFSRIVIAVH